MQRSICIAALHNICFPSDRNLSIVLTADAHGGFPPSAAAAAVPLWRFKLPSHLKGPSFLVALFFCPDFRLSMRQP
ncbi:hypothetical protein EXN67_26090 [Rhizobium rhizogenes]|nr:hypothetical protein EXN67_26090 [Rhizobium rhizogenes]TRB39451.1 hypothetical protein EXN73_25655 [Rhizobium rhizogenes]TRB54727.1 hypothetical protein EXN71_25640 [Rhizobium rhizogenes]